MRYYVLYEVEGYPGLQKAGPYDYDEVEFQRRDIAGFACVRNVRVQTENQIVQTVMEP